MENKMGFVLTWVLGALLLLTLLFTALLHLPGNLRKHAVQVAGEVQKVYDAESSLLLHLEGIPQSLFPELPPVSAASLGPYERLCATSGSAPTVCITAVAELQGLGYREWHAGIQTYRESLRESILAHPAPRRYSGNRRLFEAPGSSYLRVEDGDLRLHLPGSVPALNAFVSGDVVVEGETSYDTLRIYALGRVTLKGDVRAAFLEVAGGELVEVSGTVRFRGMLSARREIALHGHAEALYPSVAIAIGQNDPSVKLDGSARLSGLLAALPGEVRPGDSIMPAFLGEGRLAFERGVRW